MRRRRRRSVSRDVQAIRRSLGSIGRALARLTAALEAATRDSSNPSRSGRKLRLSAARRAALKLQGRYIGYVRALKSRQKAQVKALRSRKGIRAAIGLARRLARTPRK